MGAEGMCLRPAWMAAAGASALTLVAVTGLVGCADSGSPSAAGASTSRGSATSSSAARPPVTSPSTAATMVVTVTPTVTVQPTLTDPPVSPVAPLPPASAPVPGAPGSVGAAAPGAAAPTPQQVLAAAQAAGVPLVVEDGWDAEWDLPSRQADWHPIGVMLHHTGSSAPGSAPSLQFLLDYQSTMVLTDYDGLAGGGRGANFLVGRDGMVYLLRATRGPHAGIGGPMNLAGDEIASDNANGRLFGIEIESAGSSGTVTSGGDFTDGFGEAQVQSTAKLSAALLDLVGRGADHLTDHKAWAGAKQGKVDLVGDSVELFRTQTAAAMGR